MRITNVKSTEEEASCEFILTMKLSYWRITDWFWFFFFLFAQEQQVEISDFYAKVYLAPTTSSRFIGLAQKGETYTVVETRDAWLRIRFKMQSDGFNRHKLSLGLRPHLLKAVRPIHPARPQLSRVPLIAR